MNMFNPPHAGELIIETLDELNISARDLAKALHVAPSTVHRILKGTAIVTPEMAIKLSKVLGSSPKFWLNIQDNYSLYIAAGKVDVTHLESLVTTA
ncbi:MAG TPA: addiction module antidote protein, HigA family [Providencia sp.]|uniref:HigA family addiction module antitoxin n=1 Tax=Providencia sp. TaxID=589 RepID=UPI000E9F1C70|nr:HigA family addiction module antitoxin [Providencia sp.]MBP6081006.1 HigA family addiction module antidote protein [Providencia sp.]HBO24288.1 addiction module antidote protein, HigA family [Providencia sp.]